MYAIILLLLSTSLANGNVDNTINLVNTDSSRRATHAVVENRFEKLTPSVVEVRNAYGYGTGTVVEYEGERYVLTAAHVVRGVSTVSIVTPAAEVNGTVLYQNQESDLAIVSIPNESDVKAYKLRKRKRSAPMGEELFYCGFPNRTTLACFKGIVSLSSDEYLNMHSYAWMGASGSLVVDSRGRAVGILSAVEVGQFLGIPSLIEDIVWIRPLDFEFYEALESLQ